MQQILERSLNAGAAWVGQKLGSQRLIDYFHDTHPYRQALRPEHWQGEHWQVAAAALSARRAHG